MGIESIVFRFALRPHTKTSTFSIYLFTADNVPVSWLSGCSYDPGKGSVGMAARIWYLPNAYILPREEFVQVTWRERLQNKDRIGAHGFKVDPRLGPTLYFLPSLILTAIPSPPHPPLSPLYTFLSVYGRPLESCPNKLSSHGEE